MIQYLFSGNVTMILFSLISSLIVVWFILPLMGWAEAKVADKLGDPTPRNGGFLSLNPMRHIDPFGALFIIFFGFGWGKGVAANPYYFKNRKSGTILSALAGPLVLLLSSLVLCFVQQGLTYAVFQTGGSQFLVSVITILKMIINLNVAIAVFNILPIPPLSGSRILFALLPPRYMEFYYRYQQIFFIALMVLIFSRVLTIPIAWLSNLILEFLYWIAALPFQLFS